MADFQSRLRYEYLGNPNSSKRTVYDAIREIEAKHPDLSDYEKWVEDEFDPAFICKYILVITSAYDTTTKRNSPESSIVATSQKTKTSIGQIYIVI